MDLISTVLRQIVSSDKVRYADGSYNLDLTYITDRVIAMSFPANGVESTWRNFIDDVASFLKAKHGSTHYYIFNLSEKDYDSAKFGGKVHSWCRFPDHHPPPLTLLLQILYHMQLWLSSDPENVIVVHCQAGKGRTGTVISSFLLYAGLVSTATDALNFFAHKRTISHNGVSYPSQRRYVSYIDALLHHHHHHCASIAAEVPQPPPPLHMQALQISKMKFSWVPKFSLGFGKSGFIPVVSIFDSSNMNLLFNSATRSGNDPLPHYSGDTPFILDINCIVWGDILIRVDHVNYMIKPELVCRISFHTGFIFDNCVVMRKENIDMAHDDPRFPTNFTIEITFTDAQLPPAHKSFKDLQDFGHLLNKTLAQSQTGGSGCWFQPINDKPDESRKLVKLFQQPRPVVTLKSGILQHLLIKSNSWEVVSFHLSNNEITFCRSHDTGLAKVIPMYDVVHAAPPTTRIDTPSVHCMFRVVTFNISDKTKFVEHTFKTSDPQLCQEWVSSINAARTTFMEENMNFMALNQSPPAPPLLTPAGPDIPARSPSVPTTLPPHTPSGTTALLTRSIPPPSTAATSTNNHCNMMSRSVPPPTPTLSSTTTSSLISTSSSDPESGYNITKSPSGVETPASQSKKTPPTTSIEDDFFIIWG
ncbi:phosphatidylinositol-3,4,5-trisphosphate 3-phosphatase [Pelomyxa schiedti]|nr:phosphatidylinositol-3,4,5-trisphosphate 3-phosphatase [Pelomyxa schiedti]